MIAMRMKKLEIQGFKSFADKLALEFDGGITAIVGPNGSGKSNVADAIRWVLGEQSVKLLRGAKMEDVIFAGTENRKAVSFAQVSITFDNSSQLFPLDYSEVCITRRVYRSGESEYYINKSRCRLKDIHEMLMDTGIGKDGYSLIGQGQVEKLLSSKPDDRRYIFEEAAGIVKYKSRKLSAEKKLEEEHQNLLRINDIISEIENQLEPLEKQAEKTKLYLGYSEELKIYEMNQFINEHEIVKERMLSIDDEISLLIDQIEKSKIEQVNAKEKNNEFIHHVKNIEDKIEVTRNQITSLTAEIEKFEGDLKVTRERQGYLNQDITRLKSVIDESNLKITEKDNSICGKKDELNQLEEGISLYKDQLDEINNRLNKADQAMNDALAHLSENKSVVTKLFDEITDKKTALQREEIMIEQIDMQHQKLGDEKREFAEKLSEHERVYNDLNNKKIIFKKTLSEYNEKMQNYQHVSEEKKAHLNKLMEGYQKIINDLNMRRSRLRFLEDMNNDYEGFNKSVKKIMQLREQDPVKWNKIHGVVADLMHVPKKYETAIEIALGGSIQNLVTEDEQSAKNAIAYLKTNKLGRATFLPLNMMQERKNNRKDISTYPGFIGFGNEIIKYGSQYSRVMSRLLGNVIVATDFDSASKIAKAFGQYLRVVTLEGEQFNIGGSITGGSIYKKNSSILSRKREIEELKELIKKGQKKILERQEKIDALKDEIAYNDDQYKTFMNNYTTCNAQLSEVEQKVEQVDYLRSYVSNKMIAIDGERNNLREEKQNKTDSMEAINQIISELMIKKNTIQVQHETTESTIEEKRQLKESLNKEATDITIKYNELKQTGDRLKDNIKWLQNDIDELVEVVNKSNLQIDEHYKEIENLDEQAREHQKLIKTKEETLAGSQAGLKDLEEKKELIAKKRVEFEEKIESCLEKINLLNNELSRFENQKTRLEVQLDNLRERMWEDYQITYSTCLDYKQELGSNSQIKSHIDKLKRQIKDLGNINMNAIEEFKATKERYEFLTTQKDDIITAEEKLRLLIEELTKAMEEQFEERFKIIANEFNTVFSKLFGGGKGLLQLSDASDPLHAGIEIVAQPPGKKLQSMMLLSGGEKALTAIALLFAIQKMNPSPFCVLDEIEAALDDYNIKRFAGYLRDLSRQTQYLIITHRKGTMESANALYGITMEEKGVSKSVSVKFDETEDELQYA